MNHASKKPHSLENHVFVSVLRAADKLGQDAEALMKSFGLTGAQYNVLRILRGGETCGLACKEIGDRMISHDPDMTRLLDRLEKRGWITRERQKEDRRVVKTKITAEGLSLLKKMDEPVENLHKEQFRRVPAKQLRQLCELLEEILPGITE